MPQKQPAGFSLSKARLVQASAWLLGGMVCLLAIVAWGDDLNWHFSPLSAYVIFPVLGLTAYSLMWSMYIIGAASEVFKFDGAIFVRYFTIAGWAVLALICLHPGLLIFQRFRDGFGLPPGSYESYVAPGLGWVTLLGTASLLIFLAYELRRVFGERRWWHYVVSAGDLAMVAIFYHGLRLGTDISHGWFRTVWWLYGLSLIIVLIRKYTLQYQHHRTRPN